MYNSIIELMASGVTVITPTQHLSRHLCYQYANHQIRNGKQAWQTPNCLPWTAWCKHSFDRLVSLPSNDSLILLNELQQQWIWQQIISHSFYRDHLLQTTVTAKQVMQAYALCKQWDVPIFPQDVYLTVDACAFKSWVNAYETQKRNNSWLDDASLPDFIRLNVKKLASFENKVLFYDFDFFTTQQTNLFRGMEKNNIEMITLASVNRNQTVSVCIETDICTEIKMAAIWAKKKLQADPEATIGIITPDLMTIRNKIDYGFTSVLVPDQIVAPYETSIRLHSISLGKSLLTYPLIATAMNILKLGKNKISLNVLSALLHSPFITGVNTEANARAKFDSELRKTGEQQFNFKTIYRIADKYFKKYEPCKDFIQLLSIFEHSRLNHTKRQTLRQWVTVFSNWLSDFGWPGERNLNSVEYQIYQEWLDALNKLNSLDSLTKPVSFDAALLELNSLVAKTHFQPETPETPIQISGITGVAGMQFDYLWLMNMRDKHWPAFKQANPFIPLSYQRQFNIPDASVEIQLKHAKLIIQKLIRSAKDVIFSYAKQDDDRDCRPSPLIKQWLPNTLTIQHDPRDDLQSIIRASLKLETFVDIDAPPIKAGYVAYGGSALFKDQAACPFKAFVRHRLNAKSLNHTDIGLSALDRGNLVHRSLQYLWQRLKTSRNLHYYSETELNNLIRSVVQKIIKQQTREQPETFTKRFTELEQLRLQHLLKKWLMIERDRIEFKVIAVEQWQTVLFQDIKLHLRIDRVDELIDGRCIIIDYKTGSVSKNHLKPEKQIEPQIPLYAITHDKAIAAVAFASLKRNKLGFVGQSDGDNILPGIKQDSGLSWSEYLSEWEHVLIELVNDFCQGKAIVKPTYIACRQCDLHALCRIYERVESPNKINEEKMSMSG